MTKERAIVKNELVVGVRDAFSMLWLPQEVEVLWETNGQEDGEIHRYSRYQLFRATIKLRP